jgi:hypothetical protein
MPPTAAPHDLAYTTALVAACQRIWAAPDVAALWRIVLDEALAFTAADGAAVVSHNERFWQILAARPGDASPNESAVAAATEMLFRQGLLRQPISIDDLAEDAASDGLGWRALLVVRIGGSPRQAGRPVWYARRPATLSPYADIARGIRQPRQSGLKGRCRTRPLEPGGSRTASRRLAQGILMTRRQLTADQAFTLLQRRSQITIVKLRTIAQRSSRQAICRSVRRVRPDDTTVRNPT